MSFFDYEEYYKLYNAGAASAYEKNKELLFAIIENNGSLPSDSQNEKNGGMDQTDKNSEKNMEKGAERTADKNSERSERKKRSAHKQSSLNRYIVDEANYLKTVLRFEQMADEAYFSETSIQKLKEKQEELFASETTKYVTSCLMPSNACKYLGPEIGPVLSAVSFRLRRSSTYAYRHMRFAINMLLELFLDVVRALSGDNVKAEQIAELVRAHDEKYALLKAELSVYECYLFDPTHGEDIILHSDLSDPGYLYRFPFPVTDNELRLSKFMNQCTGEEIDLCARTFVDAFRKSFFADGKDFMLKKTVGISHRIGMERLTRRIMQLFENQMHYTPFIMNLTTTATDQQCKYDHRFDEGWFLNQSLVEKMTDALNTACQEQSELLKFFGGRAYLMSFGENAFVPHSSRGTLTPDASRQELLRQWKDRRRVILDQMMPERETSYTMMALPVPSIGKDFEAIFHEMVKVNSLNNDLYGSIQQNIADALDLGAFVEIKGMNGNETDLKVALQPLADPRHQTDFYNCVADCNIPLGEVFTSPQLKGTNGLLHVPYFSDNNNMIYKDLKLTFEDGYITRCTCSNEQDPEKAAEFIRQNLLFPFTTLPMGEFAIGTNTAAYAMAKKYCLMDQMPILIIEKMGPHFAIGDTCYVDAEDVPVYNARNNKEILARENEKTALRKVDHAQAYTHIHTDLTLPYDQIGLIRSCFASGMSMDIIRGGRFVLHGTEMLNEPLDSLPTEIR